MRLGVDKKLFHVDVLIVNISSMMFYHFDLFFVHTIGCFYVTVSDSNCVECRFIHNQALVRTEIAIICKWVVFLSSRRMPKYCCPSL